MFLQNFLAPSHCPSIHPSINPSIHPWRARYFEETGETLRIALLRCEGRRVKGRALLPRFISLSKQFCIREIDKAAPEAQARRAGSIGSVASAAAWMHRAVQALAGTPPARHSKRLAATVAAFARQANKAWPLARRSIRPSAGSAPSAVRVLRP
jgi:hypothetical protein